MPTIAHEFDWPDRVVIGTLGQPGSRTFYLQVRDGRRVLSATLEKEQSALLAEKIDEILDQLMATDGNPFSVPAVTPVELVDNDPLDPVEEQFRTGAMGLGWDPTTAQVVLEAYPLVVVEVEGDDETELLAAVLAGDDDPEPEEVLRVRMPVGTARAFAQRTREIVGGGRPICPLCGTPIDPEGHVCVDPDDL